MKRTLCILCALLAVLPPLSACQPTPEEDVVVNKGEGTMENIILATAAPAAPPEGGAEETPAEFEEPLLREALGAPERWSEEPVTQQVPLDMLTVIMDAEVIIPEVARAPVYTARMVGDDADVRQTYLDALFGGLPLYRGDGSWLKSDYLAIINSIQQELEALDPADYGTQEEYEYDRQELQRTLDYNIECYAEAPEDYDLEEWDGDLGREFAGVMSPVPGDGAQAYQWLDMAPSYLQYSRTGHSDQNYSHSDPPIAPDTEQARGAQAAVQALLDELGLDQFSPDAYIPGFRTPHHSFSNDDSAKYESGFQFTMEPHYGGIPVHDWDTRSGSDTGMQGALSDEEREAMYSNPLTQESLTAIVDDGQVSCLIYWSPMEIVRTENESVALLPFAQVQQRFWEQIFRNYYVDEGYPLALRITDVELSLMFVRKADAPEEYYLLPVWDFRGYDLTPGDDPDVHQTDAYYERHPDELARHINWWSIQSMLTLNAIDGSVINRNVGY